MNIVFERFRAVFEHVSRVVEAEIMNGTWVLYVQHLLSATATQSTSATVKMASSQ